MEGGQVLALMSQFARKNVGSNLDVLSVLLLRCWQCSLEFKRKL